MFKILLLVKVKFLTEPDCQAVALYSFRGALVVVGKWLRASTQHVWSDILHNIEILFLSM